MCEIHNGLEMEFAVLWGVPEVSVPGTLDRPGGGGKGWGWSKQLPDVEESQEPCHILTHNARLVKSPQEVRSGFLTPPLS